MTSGQSAPLGDAELAAALADIAPPACGGCSTRLLRLLQEGASIYRGRGTVEAESLRAYVMTRLGGVGLSDELVPYAMEELESGINPVMVAAAAQVVKQAALLPAETSQLMLKAIERIRHVDQFVGFDSYPLSHVAAGRTAVGEVVLALSSLGDSGLNALEDLWQRYADTSYLSSTTKAILLKALEEARQSSRNRSRTRAGSGCCMLSGQETESSDPQPISASVSGIAEIELENQDGQRSSFARIFGGRWAVIGFFYTRCMNPDKCSRTISQLGMLGDLVSQLETLSQTTVAAITYDPAYDMPRRLHAYGSDRGWSFSDRCQLLRTTGPFRPISSALNLGVGYGASTVNRHRLELVIIDGDGRVAQANVRRLWDAHIIVASLEALRRKSDTV